MLFKITAEKMDLRICYLPWKKKPLKAKKKSFHEKKNVLLSSILIYIRKF